METKEKYQQIEKRDEQANLKKTDKVPSRRDFLKLMGATAVMVSASCRRPTERIVPAVIRSPEISPGLSNYYSTMSPDGIPLIVKTRDGRPLKISGNPDFPLVQGGISAYHLADLMDLYDPDRIRKPLRFTKEGKKTRVSLKRILENAKKNLSKDPYVILSGPIRSASSKQILTDFLKENPGGKHIQYDANPTQQRIAEAQSLCYKTSPSVPLYRFDRCEVIVSIDGDFLGAAPGNEYYGKMYAKSRNVYAKKERMNRLTVFEAMMSVTGSNADYRYPIMPNGQLLIALALLATIDKKYKPLPAPWHDYLQAYHPSKITQWLSPDIIKNSIYEPDRFVNIIEKTCKDLWQARGKSLVYGGGIVHENGNSLANQLVINLLNSTLKNDGNTVDYRHTIAYHSTARDKEMTQLAKDLMKQKIKNVILLDVNPVYHLPEEINFADALKKASYVLAISQNLNESSSLATEILPLNHYLESWNYYQPIRSIHAIAQPMIRPLYESMSGEDVLMQLSKKPLSTAKTYSEYVKNYFQGQIAAIDQKRLSFNQIWNRTLKNGYYLENDNEFSQEGGKESKARTPDYNSSLQILKKLKIKNKANLTKANEFQLGIYSNVQVREGDGANNTLRQELPEPITKIVWDNYAVLLPATARKLNIKQGDLLEIELANKKIIIPAHLQPGVHPKALLIAQGYGRAKGGKIATEVGVAIRSKIPLQPETSQFQYSVAVTIKNSKKSYVLASTQAIYRNGWNKEAKAAFAPESLLKANYNGSSQYDRPLIRETKLKDYLSGVFQLKPEAVEYPKDQELVSKWEYNNHRWHMIIDLNSCTGCGACVTSCNTENNIPMVGKEQVSYGREMHWIRIDRYFSGNEQEAELGHQPMLCQHCENAPCENVCPVAATTHNSEGLNTMTYNRCIGTRYCANNCPYKVRRFNYYEYWNFWEGFRRKLTSPQHLALNPDVTVRTRGVVEKCTFCVQRINLARQETKSKGKKLIPDKMIKTACQEVCPSGAISFGNILDQKSEVNKELEKSKDRSYHVLEYLNVKPSISYLAKIRNRD